MTTEPDLDHLLSRLERGVLLPEEAEVLAAEVRRLRDERDEAVRSRDRVARGWVRAHLTCQGCDCPAPPAPLDAAVAASRGGSGAGDAGAVATRQAGAEGVALTAAALHPVPDAPSTATSGPQGADDGRIGAPEGQGCHGAADGRTAARGGAR
ncbi:hypothetical protein [Streptomyces harbinensis]|uniref:hypothetical protein n=1 Tax=Streptomyces harbinensis TaxID=1176198 RepID=UPI0036C34D19